jgi:hypothetical protein
LLAATNHIELFDQVIIVFVIFNLCFIGVGSVFIPVRRSTVRYNYETHQLAAEYLDVDRLMHFFVSIEI